MFATTWICSRSAWLATAAATVGVAQIASELNARILLFRQRGLGPGQRKQRAHFEARDGSAGGGGACTAGDDHPDGGELPKSHQVHSRSGHAVSRPVGGGSGWGQTCSMPLKRIVTKAPSAVIPTRT